MLKCLAIVGLLLAVAPVVSSQPNKAPDPEKQRAKQSQPAVPPADSQNKQNSSQTDQAKPGSNAPAGNATVERSHWWTKPDWWLLLIAAVTAGFICWQSWETRKASSGAFLNAQALINAERPWIMVTVEEVIGPMGGFNLYMTNKGRTPAMVTGAYIGCVAVKDLSALPNKAPYGPGSMARDRIVLPDEKLPITWFSGGTLKKIVGDGFPSLHYS
jgi:hypothetical protein